ncbi:hypothetical protein B2G88_02965 [Natronolimnobius baerhuensis]|uniref:Uncharacterized protein n=1 Tax=Natronolimnobius baerhuensis TaxID=253108 RepID=A0A202EC44_9EURY|nr:hypothetical protein [Natronolimnobius baerhuensis]OVE85792.1 hypothetical protein B2G88_02965 [Natronolimnobius baerhuensis]
MFQAVKRLFPRGVFASRKRNSSGAISQIELEGETVERVDGLRIEDESYDELVTELLNIYETGELTLFHAGD